MAKGMYYLKAWFDNGTPGITQEFDDFKEAKAAVKWLKTHHADMIIIEDALSRDSGGRYHKMFEWSK